MMNQEISEFLSEIGFEPFYAGLHGDYLNLLPPEILDIVQKYCVITDRKELTTTDIYVCRSYSAFSNGEIHLAKYLPNTFVPTISYVSLYLLMYDTNRPFASGKFYLLYDDWRFIKMKMKPINSTAAKIIHNLILYWLNEK